MLELKRWVMDQNSTYTCAFVTVLMILFVLKGVPIIKTMRQSIYDLNFKIRRMNGEMTPRYFTLGVCKEQPMKKERG